MGGQTTRNHTALVCYTLSECDAEAIKANTDHATVKAMRKKWRRQMDGPDTCSLDGGLAKYWDNDIYIYAKNSNCTGDSAHPLSNVPSGDTYTTCGPTNCMAP